MFYEAYDLFSNGKYQECLPMFKEIADSGVDQRFSYWSLIFIGRCKVHFGDHSALEDFERALDIFPERAEAMYEIGKIHHLTGNIEQAERFLRMAIACKREHACIRYEAEKYFESPHELLIDICMEQSRFNDSEELLTGLFIAGNRSRYNVKNAEHNHLYSRFFNNAGLEFMKARTIERGDVLVIQTPESHDGLGDNFVFSHIPRIAKEIGGYKEVLVSKRNRYKGEAYADIVWKTNPYVDGFTDLPGTYSSVQMNRVMDKWNNVHPSLNIMDSIMLLHNLDDGKRGHTPECYYKPRNIEWLNESTIIDAGANTMDLHLVDPEKLSLFLRENGIHPDYVISSKQSSKTIPLSGIKEISPSSIEEWADMMYSAKNYVCFNSGGYWLSGALGIKANHIWIESKNLPAWSFLDHKNIKVHLSTISLKGT